MDVLYAILILLLSLIEDLESAFQTKAVINSFANEKVLFESDEPSLLQCAQRCRFIDKNAIIDFKGSKCTCLKYDTDEGQEQNGTLTGVFVNQDVIEMKHKKIDGGLSEWKDITACTVTCGEGTLSQIKTCTNPSPQNGGKDCVGNQERTAECNMHRCRGGCTGELERTLHCNNEQYPCKGRKQVYGNCCKYGDCTFLPRNGKGEMVCEDNFGYTRECAPED